jgi:putative FmdB family regulatory protein
MPTYEYLCSSCGHNYEIVQKISEDSLKTCPSCGKDELKRIIGASNFHLKGSGWYKTDYASSGSANSASSSNSTSSTESKPASTPAPSTPAASKELG